jgi:hypothetical protein
VKWQLPEGLMASYHQTTAPLEPKPSGPEFISLPRLHATGGPLRFYAGFPTYYVRIAPHAMLTLIAQDFIKKSGSSI